MVLEAGDAHPSSATGLVTLCFGTRHLSGFREEELQQYTSPFRNLAMVHHTVAGRLPRRKPFLVRSLNSIDSAQMRIINTTSPFVAASCRQMYRCRPVACMDTTHVRLWTLGGETGTCRSAF